MLTHIHPCPLWCASTGAPLFPGPTCPATPEAATCPESLGTLKVLPLTSWCHHHVRGRYPTVIARTDSCASPQPSRCLGDTLGEWVYAGCCQPLLGGGPSRRCTAHLSLRAWTPPPAAREVHVPVSSPKTAAFPSFGPGRRSTKPVQRFQHGALFEAAVMRSCAGPQVCSPPRSLLPIRHTPHGSRDFSIRASHGLFPPHAPDMLAVRIGQLTAEDFHLIRCAALSAAPRTLGLSHRVAGRCYHLPAPSEPDMR